MFLVQIPKPDITFLFCREGYAAGNEEAAQQGEHPNVSAVIGPSYVSSVIGPSKCERCDWSI